MLLVLTTTTFFTLQDLRWNNCGLIGGRAFVDLLQWNQVLVELDLIGNEIPEGRECCESERII